MKKYLILFILLLSTIIINGCSKDSTPACSTSSNIDSSNCVKTVSTPEVPVSLNITFKDSDYYDINTQTWKKISKDNLAGGIVGGTIPIYSSFLNTSTDIASSQAYIAADQKARPTAYPTANFNQIPFIEIEYEAGVTYQYQYEKLDLNNNIVYSTTGTMLIYQGRAFLPLINVMFNNQFYSATATAGARFIHRIKISAVSKDKIGTISPTIEFETNFQIPNVDFYIKYADSMLNFNLKDRFKTYFKGSTDYNYNDEAAFFTLKQLNDAQQVPLDIRIVFQTPPVLKMQQEVFFENPIDTDTILSTLKATDAQVQRGFNFYTQQGEFTSANDFKMKFKVNNQYVTLDSGREAIITNLPVGTKWDMDFLFDFNQNSLYTSPDNKALFNPLKPVCTQGLSGNFNPLQELSDKATAISIGGYISICHPKTNSKLTITPDQMAITPYQQTDTFFSHFNYLPMDLSSVRQTGFFEGIRRVTFIAEGCVRVYARQAGASTWELKTNGNSNCDTSNNGSDNGWTYFYAEKTATIFDNITDYELEPGLKTLMQYFSTRPIKQTSDFKFNGSDININRHVY